MARGAIAVDLFNPGQVFACLGFMEAADGLCGEAYAAFDWTNGGGVRFVLQARGEDDPFAAVLAFLNRAKVRMVAAAGCDHDTAKWNVELATLSRGAPFPFPLPDSPATLPALLDDGTHTLQVDYWGDATRRDNVKFWAGSGGYPGGALLRDALDLLRPLAGEEVAADPFSVSAPQKSSFRFDWRRDYIPLDAGFSLNEHGHIQPLGYPVVEVLAALGVAHARPQRLSSKLEYRYGVVGSPPSRHREEQLLPPTLVRAALGASPLPFPRRSFVMELGWPGQENQARCITTVTEENIA